MIRGKTESLKQANKERGANDFIRQYTGQHIDCPTQCLSAENDAERALERLASGVRVNNAGDDAAGLAIAQRHSANILGMAGAVRNSANTQSLLAVADGALAAATNGLIRINELAAAAANPVVGAQELKMIQSEIDQLIKELDRTSDRTTFNNTALLNGGFKTNALW